MQRYCTELTERLLKSLDKEYNVVDMGAVVDVITALEKTTITKEVLEITRLGKYINELRRKTSNDALAKRAKDLVRRWRDMVLPSAHSTPQPTPADTAPQALNGTKPQSPALRGLKPQSPALKNFKPHSPLMRDTNPFRQVLSPALSLHSDHSRSPNPTPTKQQPSLGHTAPTTRSTNTTNHRLNSNASPKLGIASTQNHTQIEAVPRTHSSNKRLRKDDTSPVNSPENTPPLTSTSSVKSIRSDSNDSLASRLEPQPKRQRLNGETSNFGCLSKFTESYASNNNVVSGRGLTNVGSRSLKVNQQVPSPRETEKSTVERLLPDVTTSVESSRDAADSAVSAGPKKRGRKKGSKALKNQTLPEDRVKEKLASISRNPKLKTTQELLADLQARGSSIGVAGTTTTTGGFANRNTEPPTTEEILRNSVNDDRPLSSRFLRSGRDKTSSFRSSNFSDSTKGRTRTGSSGKRWESTKPTDDDDESPTEDNEVISGSKDLTVEQILAKLPPLDLDAIRWSDCEDDNEEHGDEEDATGRETVKEISLEDVDRLHGATVEGLNGNFQERMKISRDDDETKTIDGARNERIDDVRASDARNVDEFKRKGVCRRLGETEDGREFREWHEMLAKPSYEGQTLHILPYVIID